MVRLTTYIEPEKPLVDLGFPGSRMYALNNKAASAQENVDIGADFVDHFTAGMKVLVLTRSTEDETAQIYKIEEHTVASITSRNVTLADNLGQTFNVAENAALQAVSKYTMATRPTWSELDRVCQNAQDFIDAVTHTSWGQRVRAEWHNFHPGSRRMGYWAGTYARRLWNRDMDFKVPLDHNHVKALSATVDTAYTGYPGDSIVIWNGTEWVEWLNAANPYSADSVDLKTEGRNSDYWLNYEQGIFYFANERPDYTIDAFRIVYRHGQTVREAAGAMGFGDIEEATANIAKARILQDRRFSVDWPGGRGADALSVQQAISGYKNEAKDILSRHIQHPSNYDNH